MPADLLRGGPVADDIEADVEQRVAALSRSGVTPFLGTVLASDRAEDHRFMDLKHDACSRVGIGTRDNRLPGDADPAVVHRTVDELCQSDTVDGVFVQLPLPDHVSVTRVRKQLDPYTDVDCFHPENLGRLVGSVPRFVPATTVAVERLLDAAEESVAGRDIVVVGRSPSIGLPLANRLLQRDATVTVCHSRTEDLAAKTRQADVLVTACGVPELVTREMLSPGVVVVDVSSNHVTKDGQTVVVGDVDAEAAAAVARARTPVPGGVGPVTLAALLENVVLAAERRHDGEQTLE